MADVVLGGVVESVTGHLVSLVSQEIRLACGVRAELVKLQTTVSIIGGMLREADKRRVEAEDVKEWLKKLKELFCDADDLLDDFSTEVLRRRRVTGGVNRILNEVRIFFSSSNQLLYPSEMAHRVKEIRERIDAIWNDRSACFRLEGNSNLMGSLVESRARPETIPFKSDPYVIGGHKDKEKVIEFLLNPNFEENVSVLPIVGVGDDVWNDNRSKWLELREFLMSGAKGSKILVTTRYIRVVETMTRKFHKLSGLSNNESLSLLMQMAMKEEHEWKSQNLEKIAGEIVKKCAGVPLAIKTIGRLLVFSGSTEEDWLNFKDNDLSSIDQEESDIMPTLKLSYDFLPSHLKPCFAYCSLFPQDYLLEPRELVYLWMAQGFINKPLGSKKTLEEVGYDYFRELLSRSLFQDIKEDVYGDIMWCRMHDLMHDLARLVAGKNCITIDSSHEERFQEGARHVTTNDPNVLNGFATDRRIRSMFLIVEKRIHIARLDVSCFRSLRALRIRRAGIKVISRSIGKLKHLRSLDLLGNNELRCLPNSISRLCNLESLILTVCRDLEGLPSGITKLVNLRQLSVEGCDKLTHMPRGIGKLTSLQRIEEEDGDSSSSSSSLLILPCFSDKVKVNIDYCPRFSYMQHGQQLFLHQHDPVFLPLGPQRSMAVLVPTDPYPSPSPSTISDSLSLTALTSLSISEIEDAEHLPGELFQSLPSLQSLIISNCPRLKALPLGAILRYVSTLETLKISDCPELDLSTENDDDNDDGGDLFVPI
ncbi:hypothetical protein CRG98_009001 [Punica granatum]|uniref:Disease resistance protein RGA3 n=1 Tax=Punica granatum TaxID=22663 RepID=A0A2I0KRN6_PUNGR|nr:hypothetical protein CRG98_009001 [Punica granatum]